MKKKIVFLLLLILGLSGCGEKNLKKVIEDFQNKVLNTTSYSLKANMEIYGDEETYTYSIEADYLKDNYYKVRMVNQTNNHEQIILRNADAVYVVTPSLNKSFKFQSDWPNNSSQSYLLKSLAKDMGEQEDTTIEEKDGTYLVKSKVNYPNNPDLVYQITTFDKEGTIKKNEIYNEKDELKMKITFGTINYKANLKEKDFLLENYIQEEETPPSSQEKCESDGNCKKESTKCEGDNCNKQAGAIEDILYPLYIPSNTYLTSSDKVSTEVGNRIILTFAGEKNFVLVEEPASASSDFEIIPVYGDPLFMQDTIAALGANSLSWTKDSINYYLAGNDLTTEELLSIGKSIGYNTKSVAKEK